MNTLKWKKINRVTCEWTNWFFITKTSWLPWLWETGYQKKKKTLRDLSVKRQSVRPHRTLPAPEAKQWLLPHSFLLSLGPTSHELKDLSKLRLIRPGNSDYLAKFTGVSKLETFISLWAAPDSGPAPVPTLSKVTQPLWPRGHKSKVPH